MDAYIIMYDVTDHHSFDALEEWIKCIKALQSYQYCTPVIMVVGNKSDLDFQRQVKPEELAEFAKLQGIEHSEVSAKHKMFTKDIIDQIMCKVHGPEDSTRITAIETENKEAYCCSVECKLFSCNIF
jgi:GTPase SAR1 family protein